MTEKEDSEIIDPPDLDAETLRAVKELVRGYCDTSPAEPQEELSEYRIGRRDAFNAVLARITQWLEQVENNASRDSNYRDADEESK